MILAKGTPQHNTINITITIAQVLVVSEDESLDPAGAEVLKYVGEKVLEHAHKAQLRVPFGADAVASYVFDTVGHHRALAKDTFSKKLRSATSFGGNNVTEAHIDMVTGSICSDGSVYVNGSTQGPTKGSSEMQPPRSVVVFDIGAKSES